MSDPLLREQIDYYRARAAQYDEWFFRQGRYDLGPEENARWRSELEQLERALTEFDPGGRVLELAGGTGLWTRHLAPRADHLTVVDAAPEVLAINRERVGDPGVEYVVADIFDWRPDRVYDAVVFAFWLSHVPPHQFDPFWRAVAECLAPDGRAFFVDNLSPSSTAFDHRILQPGEISVTRQLNDGRNFRIHKLFYQPPELAARLAELGWRARVRSSEHYFLYGETLKLPAEWAKQERTP